MARARLIDGRGVAILMRSEYIALLGLCLGLLLTHLNEVDWPRFLTAFVLIDLVGYLPGAIASRRHNGHAPALCHHLYNVTHSLLTWLALLPPWSFLNGGAEWAMLAVPIHLAGDRGLFGNLFKPLDQPFASGPSPTAGGVPAKEREQDPCH